MTNKVRSSLVSLVIIAVLLFSAVGPTIVYADGDTPTTTHHTHHKHQKNTTSSKDTPAADSTSAPTDATAATTSDTADASTDATATPEPAATDVPTTTDVAAPATDATATAEPAADAGTATAEATAAPVTGESAPATDTTAAPSDPTTDAAPADTATVSDVPQNTTVQVVNADGQSEPLASQAAADAIATTSDPIWCPAGQAPTPGANGCTASFTSFSALLTFLAGNATYQGAGTIFVQQGAYAGGESTVNFNNYNLSNISSSDLTITGGWNTSTGAVDPASSSTFNNTAIVIGSAANPWGGSLTINNLSLNFNPTGSSGTGLSLTSAGNINVVNVSVMNSATGAGAELNAGGDVSINNSKFDRNKTAGAIIKAKGNVAISNTSFSNPVNGRRQVVGLDITNDGSVSLMNVLANTNRQAGATINSGGSVSISSSFFSDTKAMQGSNFVGYGLQIVTPSTIALDTVTANDNFLWGAKLNAGGGVTIANSFFNANTTASPGFIDDTGLLVTSGGTVNIDNTQANDNRLIGATIEAQGDVSINNSTFTGNKGTTLDSSGKPTFHGYGLNIVTPGNVNLTGVTASNNTLFGAHVEAGLDVTVLNSDFSNQTTGSATDQQGRGLEVISQGTVILDHVTINNNQTFGANVQAAGDVFLNSVTATGNGQTGVTVQGNCTTLFLINGTYSNNGQYGLSVIHANLNQTGTPVFATNAAGDIFQDPGTCVFPVAGTSGNNGGSTPTTPSTTPSTPSTPSTSPQVSNAVTSPVKHTLSANYFGTDMMVKSANQIANSIGKVTLSTFLASGGLSNQFHLGLFLGRYAYIYTFNGMQIVVFAPETFANIAMVGPH